MLEIDLNTSLLNQFCGPHVGMLQEGGKILNKFFSTVKVVDSP